MKALNKIFGLILLVTLFFYLFACGSKTEDSKDVAEEKNEAKFEDSKIEDDTEFAIAAADGSMLEVRLGELAQSNAASEDVKAFGRQMVTDHTKAGEELKALATTKNISLPATLGEKCQKEYNDLAEKKGVDFDKAYTKFMVKDHKDDIDEFRKEADKGNDADLRAWASGKLATLEHHLSMAEAAEKKVKDQK